MAVRAAVQAEVRGSVGGTCLGVLRPWQSLANCCLAVQLTCVEGCADANGALTAFLVLPVAKGGVLISFFSLQGTCPNPQPLHVAIPLALLNHAVRVMTCSFVRVIAAAGAA